MFVQAEGAKFETEKKKKKEKYDPAVSATTKKKVYKTSQRLGELHLV